MITSDIRTLGLLLIDGFALMSYASLIEPFRAANILAGRTLYRWVHISIDGQPVRASNGATMFADQMVGEALDCDTLFVFAAGDPSTFADQPTFVWLRRLARAQVRIAGVSGGPFLLARAGLLEGYRATIHWEHQAALIEAFPTLALEPILYVIDRRRMTCAGGTAGLDFAIELIERDHGASLAAKVSEWFIRTDPRRADRPQRSSLRERHGVDDDRLLRVLAEMETSVEEPRSREQLAKLAGLSVRQLERLFASRLGRTVGQSYLDIRLAQALQLLRTTGQAVTMVAIACGFQSSSHFSRAFRERYGLSPSAARLGKLYTPV